MATNKAQDLQTDLIPLIDISGLWSDDLIDRKRVAGKIGEACETVGFFYMKNHGIKPETIDEVLSISADFFALPMDEKQKIHISKSTAHRGYFSVGDENTRPGTEDFKEGFDMAVDLPQTHPKVEACVPLHGPNLWPDHDLAFKKKLTAYHSACIEVGLKLVSAFALHLGMPEEFFEDTFSDPLVALRILHYPPHPVKDVDDKLQGIGAHSDYGCLTLLAQDEVGGLEIKHKTEGWVPAPPIRGAFTCNLGEMMQRWSNGRFKATVHRVVNRSGAERYSVPLFFNPAFDTSVSVFPTCQSADNPPKFPDIRAGDYLLKRFEQTFAYRQERDKKSS